MKKALIIDDSVFMRMAIKKILLEKGYQVVGEAENGKVGVSKYQEFQPDLVTLDITMREMDGIRR